MLQPHFFRGHRLARRPVARGPRTRPGGTNRLLVCSDLCAIESGKRRTREGIGSNQRDASMDKKIAGVIGAITGLASLDTAAQAATVAGSGEL